MGGGGGGENGPIFNEELLGGLLKNLQRRQCLVSFVSSFVFLTLIYASCLLNYLIYIHLYFYMMSTLDTYVNLLNFILSCAESYK